MNTSVELEFTYQTTPVQIWKALTDREEMKKWYFELEEFKSEVGFEFRFWGGTEEHKYLHICEITNVMPNKRICYTWRYDGIAGITQVCFEIIPATENSAILKLTHTGFETFPADNPDLDVKNFIAGWNAIIGTSLKNYLEER